MTLFTLLLSKKLFSPLKYLPTIFTNFKQSETSFERNSVTYVIPCHDYENKYFRNFCTLEPYNQIIKNEIKYMIIARMPKLL